MESGDTLRSVRSSDPDSEKNHEKPVEASSSLLSLTFSFDGRLDPGSVFGRVEVSHRHHSGVCELRFLQRTKGDMLPHRPLLTVSTVAPVGKKER